LALAAGYLFIALIVVPHALTFPGAFAPTGLLGAGLSSTAWLAVFWRAGFPLAIGAYALLRVDRGVTLQSTGDQHCATSVAGTGCLGDRPFDACTKGADLLPPLVARSNGAWHRPGMSIVAAVLIVLCLAAIAMLVRERKSRLDVWLLLLLWTCLIHLLFVDSASGRFTLAWYLPTGVGLVPHLIVMLALNRRRKPNLRQLAQEKAERNRERDVRLLSMDAVAAVIAHEVGQPHGSIVTNGSAGLRWLDRNPPKISKKQSSPLREIVEQGLRASDVIKSMRSVIARRLGEQSTFSLNELVRETVPFLARELVGAKISLHVALDETLPPIMADPGANTAGAHQPPYQRDPVPAGDARPTSAKSRFARRKGTAKTCCLTSATTAQASRREDGAHLRRLFLRPSVMVPAWACRSPAPSSKGTGGQLWASPREEPWRDLPPATAARQLACT
jgi:signal transduction histidine kinase